MSQLPQPNTSGAPKRDEPCELQDAPGFEPHISSAGRRFKIAIRRPPEVKPSDAPLIPNPSLDEVVEVRTPCDGQSILELDDVEPRDQLAYRRRLQLRLRQLLEQRSNF